MKVVLSAEAMQPPLTGVGYYTLNLLRALADIRDAQVSYTHNLILRGADGGLPEPIGQRQWPVRWMPRSVQRSFERLLIRHMACDVVHGTNFRYISSAGVGVVTVHDLALLRFSELVSPKNRRDRERELRTALEQADLIITPSEAIRSELISGGLRGPSDVVCTPLGVTPDFRPIGEDGAKPVLQARQLSYKKFALAVGTIEPRKNLLRLIAAYGALPASLRRVSPLVVCGKPGWLSDETFAAIRAAESEGWLRYIGYASKDELKVLTASAKLAIQASLYEGFCLPLLEAMACGTRVLASNDPALVELAGSDYAILPPYDAVAMTVMLEHALQDREVDQEKTIRAQSMTWDRCARITYSAYANAVGLKNRG
jgi:alpha-1,3-rhamnosyl/mannosyltransferase